MIIVQFDLEHGVGEGLDDGALNLKLLFLRRPLLGHLRSCPLYCGSRQLSRVALIVLLLLAPSFSDSLLLFHAGQFASGNVPSLAPQLTQDATGCHRFAEALQQTIYRLPPPELNGQFLALLCGSQIV